MEVLNLATKEKQDEILSNFPISGGTDFSSYTPIVTSATSLLLSSANGVVLDVTGSGILTNIFVRTVDFLASKIVVDGTELDIGSQMRIASASSTNVFISFNSSLTIEGRSASNSNGSVVQFFCLMD